MRALTHERLRSAMSYDEDTGELSRLSGAFAGRPAGHISRGYRYVSLFGTKYLAHRLVWFYVHGKWPECFIDHIDGNRSNNAIRNLREASYQQSAQNRVTAGFCESSSSPGRYRAYIYVNRKQIYLGTFKTAQLAAEVRRVAAENTYGEFSASLSRGAK